MFYLLYPNPCLLTHILTYYRKPLPILTPLSSFSFSPPSLPFSSHLFFFIYFLSFKAQFDVATCIPPEARQGSEGNDMVTKQSKNQFFTTYRNSISKSIIFLYVRKLVSISITRNYTSRNYNFRKYWKSLYLWKLCFHKYKPNKKRLPALLSLPPRLYLFLWVGVG